MQKVKVISEFYDKNNLKHLFGVGEVLEVDDDRAADLIARQLVESVEEQKLEEPILDGRKRRSKR